MPASSALRINPSTGEMLLWWMLLLFAAGKDVGLNGWMFGWLVGWLVESVLLTNRESKKGRVKATSQEIC